jgi:cyclopropane-fatty-acyl-phospholipid synthase
MATTQQRPSQGRVASVGVAHRLEAALRPFVGGDLPVRLRAWDGSEAGPVDAPLVELCSRDAVRRLLWHPGELGAAQAYVTGEIEVHHDLDEALTYIWAVVAERGLAAVRPSPRAFARALRAAVDVGALGKAPALPESQARVRGRLHSKLRDRRAISHHYDLSNEFYSLILDPAMAYSSGYYRSESASYGVEDAQRDKLDLVCQKIGLGPGMRFLDIGCGWGSLSLHAAKHYGAQVTGVTIAAEQKKFIDARIRERGLEHLVEIRLQDYREIPEVASGGGSFDAVASIEMGEHVGEQNYGTYAQVLHDAVRPGGRVLIQQMSRSGGRHGHPGGGPFIESFIAPDMHMRPIGETVAYLEQGGLEVRDVHAMREHYVRTVADWLENFEANLDRLTELVGEEVVRVWRLYLVGGAMAFRDGRMGVDQILMVRPGGSHTLPPVRAW